MQTACKTKKSYIFITALSSVNRKKEHHQNDIPLFSKIFYFKNQIYTPAAILFFILLFKQP